MTQEAKTPLGYKAFDMLQKSIELFRDQDGEDSLWWTNYFQFFGDLAKTDHRITEKVERNLFIKCIDEDLRLRLENSVLPKQIKDMRLLELVEHTRSFFRQKYNTIMERVRLHRRLQQTGETVHLHLDAWKRLAANCCFALAEYHSRLRDIFVAGLRNDEMLQKFYERDNLLTTPLEEVLAFARTLESAMDSVAATRDTSTLVNLDTIQNIRKTRHQPWQAKEDRIYVRDTYENDKQRRVDACYICGDRKHYQLVCL